MDAVLPGKAVRRGCVLQKNSLGLYDVRINDENGAVIADVKSVTYRRALTIMDEYLYQTGRTDNDR